MSKILVTGGAGFIGSNFVRLMLTETDHEIINLDLLTYAGNLENLSDVEDHARYTFVKGDITDAPAMAELFAKHKPEVVVHFAAESHVDRSIALKKGDVCLLKRSGAGAYTQWAIRNRADGLVRRGSPLFAIVELAMPAVRPARARPYA